MRGALTFLVIVSLMYFSSSFAQEGGWVGRFLNKKVPGSEGRIVAKVNINEASVKDLEVVLGISSALAINIVNYRVHHGPFKRISDLLKVEGMTPEIFSKIASHIFIEHR